jgi:4-carboxymuconolactone decarboxylase
MTDARTEGLQVFRELMPGLIPDGATSLGDGGFADELGELSTLGALIAMRAVDELRLHMPIVLRNGLTVEEIEEVVYHLTGYAGFPAANAARAVGREVLSQPERRNTKSAE